MSLYNEKDLELIKENLPNIIKEAESKICEVIEPTAKQKREMLKIVMDYVKNKKRIIYGSYAHHLAVSKANKKDAFFDETTIPDIDFYSPEPLVDMFQMANSFYDTKKYNEIEAKEAQHKETYTLFVNRTNTADCSYVPKIVYFNIPTMVVDGLTIVHPHFASIDYLRILNDPLTSWEIKLEKRVERFYKIMKNYEFPNPKKELVLINPHKELIEKTFNILKTFDSLIFIGLYAYNYFVMESNIDKKQNIKMLDIPYFELICTNYKEDAKKIIEKIKELNNNIKVIEYYPFFQFYDYSAKIFLDGKLLCTIYNHLHKCYPYREVPAINFINPEKTKDKIKIGSFLLNILYNFIASFKAKVDKNKEQQEMVTQLISNLIIMRNYYFKNEKKTLIDKSLFSDFVIDCLGKTITARQELDKRIKKNLEKGKPAFWKYNPDDGRKEEAPEFQFANSSGNEIKNEKNLKLI
jgi:hypothetical protein